jgi:tetratricopeptide (TPR) repeat protein
VEGVDRDASVTNRIEGGIFFHAVIQGRDINVVLPREISPALSGLPRASPAFTGRDDEVQQLLAGLAPGSRDGGASPQAAVPVALVTGLAGVGKTELVVQTARKALRDQGWFPGGVLFVDLFGYDTERRLSPEQALDGLLRALGVPGEHIPDGSQDRSRLYRSVLAALAREGRRILVVIDNVSTADQARPLLPGDGTCAALVTSRHTLDLDARLHDVGVLDEGACVELLRQTLLNARGPSDTRVEDDPEGAAEIARLCAGLPLAARIAAALLADFPSRPLSSVAADLDTAHTRLDRLRREDRAVRAALDLSYGQLPADRARLLRLLPLNPGADISSETAARLTDAEVYPTENLLQDLARAHLVEPAPVWGRWRLHDLVRLYADQQGQAHGADDGRDVAQARLHEHYRVTTEAAVTHLDSRTAERSPRFPDRAAALAWLDGEHRNLVVLAVSEPPLGLPETSIALASVYADHLHFRRHFTDLIDVTTVALDAVRALGDQQQAEAAALGNLGMALTGARRFDEAYAAYTESLRLWRQVGDRHGEATALNSFGTLLHVMRRADKAIDAHIRAADICREVGDRLGVCGALTNQGGALLAAGRSGEAAEVLTEAVAMYRELGDRRREATALNNLGIALRQIRRFSEAIDAYTRDIDICREFGDAHGEATALVNLGTLLHGMRRFAEAAEVHGKAVTVFRRLGDRHREGTALDALGNALRDVRRMDEAIDAHTQAVGIFQEFGDRPGEGSALKNLGVVLRDVGRHGAALDAHKGALVIFRELGDRLGEGRTLTDLAITLRTANKRPRGGTYE